MTFGTHWTPVRHTSVAGVGRLGGLSAKPARPWTEFEPTFTTRAPKQISHSDGIAKRGEVPFAMMIWDMGAMYNSLRLYTHQDHYSGGPINDNFNGQDVMDYSVWGSNDGDNFVLLSDVIGLNLNSGSPLYTFAGTEPSVVYRGGSAEHGITNAYTREYSSAVLISISAYERARSLTIPGGGTMPIRNRCNRAAFNAVGTVVESLRTTRAAGPRRGKCRNPVPCSLLGLGAFGLIVGSRTQRCR